MAVNKGPKIVNAVLAVLSLIVALLVGYGPVVQRQTVQTTDVPQLEWTLAASDLDIPHLEHSLVDGYVHNWLVAGPQATPVKELDLVSGHDPRSKVIRRYHQPKSSIAHLLAEGTSFMIDGQKLIWRYQKTLDDHLVDLSAHYHGYQYLRAWAYVQVSVPTSQEVTFVLTTDGPADLWLNGQHAHRQPSFGQGELQSASFQGELERGLNDILVRLEQAGDGQTPYAMALQVLSLPSKETPVAAEVHLPTAVEDIARRRQLETLLNEAYLESDVYHRGNNIVLHWAQDLSLGGRYAYQIQDGQKRVYVDGLHEAAPAERVNVGQLIRLWERDYQVVLGARPREYYERNLRYQRRIPIYVVDNAHSEVPYGMYEGRRLEALEDAARREDNLYAEMAKMELGEWATVDVDGIMAVVNTMDPLHNLCGVCVVGLLGMLYRYSANPAFPKDLAQDLDASIPDSPYWIGKAREWTDGERILYHTSQILAGQRYPDRIWARTGETGRWHHRQGERAARFWLHERAKGGLGAWDSSPRLGGRGLGQSALLSGPQLVQGRTRIAPRICLLSDDQEWAPASYRRHQPLAMGHGLVQSAHSRHGEPGLLDVPAAAENCRDRHRRA
jgi:hypothetical protein